MQILSQGSTNSTKIQIRVYVRKENQNFDLSSGFDMLI